MVAVQQLCLRIAWKMISIGYIILIKYRAIHHTLSPPVIHGPYWLTDMFSISVSGDLFFSLCICWPHSGYLVIWTDQVCHMFVKSYLPCTTWRVFIGSERRNVNKITECGDLNIIKSREVFVKVVIHQCQGRCSQVLHNCIANNYNVST